MTPSSKSTPSKVGSIRIIAGKHRGRKLPVINAEGLRPTSDRVKETLFNWLMQDLVGANVLDMFAGAGSLGFEALSRGAAKVRMIEKNKQAAAQLKSNVSLLSSEHLVEVHQGDALSSLSLTGSPFDIVFIDPPFSQNLTNAALDALIQSQCLANEALLYIETAATEAAMNHPLLTLQKEKSTQQVSYRLYHFSRPA